MSTCIRIHIHLYLCTLSSSVLGTPAKNIGGGRMWELWTPQKHWDQGPPMREEETFCKAMWDVKGPHRRLTVCPRHFVIWGSFAVQQACQSNIDAARLEEGAEKAQHKCLQTRRKELSRKAGCFSMLAVVLQAEALTPNLKP